MCYVFVKNSPWVSLYQYVRESYAKKIEKLEAHLSDGSAVRSVFDKFFDDPGPINIPYVEFKKSFEEQMAQAMN